MFHCVLGNIANKNLVLSGMQTCRRWPSEWKRKQFNFFVCIVVIWAHQASTVYFLFFFFKLLLGSRLSHPTVQRLNSGVWLRKMMQPYMYVVSGSRQRTIMLMDEDSRLGMSPSITHGDLAPDRMSSTKLRRVSGEEWQDFFFFFVPRLTVMRSRFQHAVNK